FLLSGAALPVVVQPLVDNDYVEGHVGRCQDKIETIQDEVNQPMAVSHSRPLRFPDDTVGGFELDDPLFERLACRYGYGNRTDRVTATVPVGPTLVRERDPGHLV